MTEVRAPELYPRRKRYHSAAAEAHLRAHPGIDPAILAADLGIPAPCIRAYQRQLGLRKITNHTERKRTAE